MQISRPPCFRIRRHGLRRVTYTAEDSNGLIRDLRTEDDPDEIIYAGFSKETARTFIENFERYLDENRDSIAMNLYLHDIGVGRSPIVYQDSLIDTSDRMFRVVMRTCRTSSSATAPVLIPLPPLAEQKRIVAKLEELLPLCETAG